MKAVIVLHLTLLFGTAALGNPARDSGIGPCTEQQLLGHSADRDEVKAHRAFSAPTISYLFGTKLDVDWGWGFTLTLRVDESGHVVCYGPRGMWGRYLKLNEQRRAVIEELKDWRYQPFSKSGKALVAIVTETINEQETPERHQPLPDVPIQKVAIGLRRSACFGTCPSYEITIDGNGRVTYLGQEYVNVVGRHSYRVPVERVERLVESLRAKDIWSLRPAYTAQITDNPWYELDIAMGSERHTLEDYVGKAAGMPSVVSEFEDEVDKATNSAMWIHITKDAIEHLEAENFKFQSAAGAALLARSVADDYTIDDQAILRLVQLGAPIVGGRASSRETREAPYGPTLESALRNQRSIIIDALIARGALQTARKADQTKIDAAFRAAIVGGRLELVEKIWNLSGDRDHPALTFLSVSREDKPVRKTASVTLLLTHSPYDHGPWDGLAIAKWLIARGCDGKAASADGTTLLHIAARAGDAQFVRYLLDTGFDPSTPGHYGLPALDSATDEEVALTLLEAGTALSRMHDEGGQFRRYALDNHWERVIAWLAAHDH